MRLLVSNSKLETLNTQQYPVDQVQFMADAEKGLKRRVREMEAEIEKARKESLDGKNDAEKAKAESEQLSKSVLKLRADLDSSKAELVSLQNVAKDRQAKDTALDFPKRLDHVKQALAEIRCVLPSLLQQK